MDNLWIVYGSSMDNPWIWLVVEPYPFEQYEFVNRDDDIPDGRTTTSSSHQPGDDENESKNCHFDMLFNAANKNHLQ